MMIASNNSSVDVDDLMRRVREEAAVMRARDTGEITSGPLPSESMAADGVVDLSRHAIIGSLIEDAARMSRPRTTLPRRLERMPYRLGAPIFVFALRILKYIFKDQAHVNASTQQALRELLRYATTIGGYVAQMSALARDQRNVARNMATLAARLDASEQRAAEIVDLSHVLEARALALEDALTVNVRRIDALEGAVDLSHVLEARALALEDALTVNVRRIDALEGAKENAVDRLVRLESANTNEHILALESANTIASQRLERLEGAQARAGLVDAAISDTRRELSAERERALRAESSLRSDLTASRRAQMPGGDVPIPSFAAEANDDSAPSHADVHLAIADKFRGDSADIVRQLEMYVAIIRNETSIDAEHPLVDVGSGRGEFLSLCRAANVPSYGIELDSFLAERARMDGLDVRATDGVSALREAGDATIGAVTAFHVIEHLSFDALMAFFDESLRALAPGGLLVCETPNPANVTIGACNFYLDPTHRHPLPSPLVAFLLEMRGFTDVRIVDLQPNDAMRLDEDSEAARRINGFFYGAQNYAAIARKPGASN
jgi:O-antigen chain-terminating methyltransferase